MVVLDIEKVTKKYIEQTPVISPELARDLCSELDKTLASVLDKPLSLASYCYVKIKHLEWLLRVRDNEQSSQVYLRKLLLENPFIKTIYGSMIDQLKAFSKNSSKALADAGFKSESVYILSVLLTDEELATKYKDGKLTIADILMSNPGLLLNNG